MHRPSLTKGCNPHCACWPLCTCLPSLRLLGMAASNPCIAGWAPHAVSRSHRERAPSPSLRGPLLAPAPPRRGPRVRGLAGRKPHRGRALHQRSGRRECPATPKLPELPAAPAGLDASRHAVAATDAGEVPSSEAHSRRSSSTTKAKGVSWTSWVVHVRQQVVLQGKEGFGGNPEGGAPAQRAKGAAVPTLCAQTQEQGAPGTQESSGQGGGL